MRHQGVNMPNRVCLYLPSLGFIESLCLEINPNCEFYSILDNLISSLSVMGTMETNVNREDFIKTAFEYLYERPLLAWAFDMKNTEIIIVDILEELWWDVYSAVIEDGLYINGKLFYNFGEHIVDHVILEAFDLRY